MTKIQHTPWGMPDHQTEVAPGIVFVSTPSHGGFYLSPAMQARVPAPVIEATWERQGALGWFEEDHDAAYVVACFPEHFEPGKLAMAQRSLAGFARHVTHGRDKYQAALVALGL